MTTEELLEEFLADYGNCQDVEELINSNPKKLLWRNLILDKSRWGKLIECLSDDDALKLFFDSLNAEDRQVYFGLGVECMINFVQANFTGPELPKSMDEFFSENPFVDVDFKKYLSVNNEEININTKHPVLLYAAKCVFKYCDLNRVLNLWWQWRAIMIHQHVLDELSQVLFSEADRIHEDIKNLELGQNWKASFEIEQGQLFNVFRNISRSEVHLERARKLLGVHYEIKARLGKRTKDQETDLAQLFLHVALNGDVPRFPVHEFEVPKDVTLDDDVRLDKIKYKDDADPIVLTDNEQRLLLAAVQEMIISKPKDDLYFEELRPFVDVILSQNNTWTVRAVIFLIRCKLEANHKRTVERSLLQCEEVVNCIKKETPHTLQRVGGIYATNFQPIWKIETQLADIMLNLGLVKASLDIYLRLQHWEEVIVCYTMLKAKHKATEIIKQQLEANPTVKLWCLLGDATDDSSCYVKAWELSKKRSSRAQRHWGHYHFTRQQYLQCIPHFEKSVSINPIQPVVWLHYGFAALETENWQTAATAYRRYTSFEPGNFEAWNNLANAYMRLGNKRSAHQAYHDALKCNYENWKVWENLMACSADIAHFSDVIRAYHRMLDLEQKRLNVEILATLVYAVCNNVNDCEGRPANRLMQKTRELLGRITSIFPTEGHAWELYASLAPMLLLRAQRLQRALRCFMQSDWNKDPANCQQVLYVCHKLAEVALSEQIESTDSLVNSVRLSLTAAVAAVKRQDFEETRVLLAEVSELLSRVKTKCESVKIENNS